MLTRPSRSGGARSPRPHLRISLAPLVPVALCLPLACTPSSDGVDPEDASDPRADAGDDTGESADSGAQPPPWPSDAGTSADAGEETSDAGDVGDAGDATVDAGDIGDAGSDAPASDGGPPIEDAGDADPSPDGGTPADAGAPLIAAPPANVVLSTVAVAIVGGREIASSTKLMVTWDAPGTGDIDHYELTAVGSGSSALSWVVPSADTRAVELTELWAATTYTITVDTCADAACSVRAASASVSATTDEEVWQFQGSGHAVSSLTPLVGDGNARLSVTRFGPEAGATTGNRLQLYYGPSPMPGSGMMQSLAVATTAVDTSADDLSSYLVFTSLAGSSGIESNASSGSTLITASGIQAGIGVPRAEGDVLLVFEARGADNKTRIMGLRSQDGLVGRDFHSGAATVCRTSADYATGGPCAPTVLIGVAGDPGGHARLNNVRQMKMGWPTLDDWRWDGAAGTFMLVTVDTIAGCSMDRVNHAYAVWDGSAWTIQSQADGCPKLFKAAQAAFPLHLGGARYKMYYGNISDTTGKLSGSMLPFLGPKVLIYGDGAHTGDPDVVDFEDWEGQSAARNVVFLWPDGTELDAAAEGYIDDYQAIPPTNDLDLQVLYVAITDGVIPPVSAAAILLNP